MTANHTTIGEYTLPDGSLTIETTEPLHTGQTVPVVATLHSRSPKRTVRDLHLRAVTRYETPDGIERRIDFDTTIADRLAVTDGVTATARETVTVPHSMPAAAVGTITPARLTFDTGGETVVRDEYVPIRVTPSVACVINPIVEMGYVVASGRVVADQTDSSRQCGQVIQFEPKPAAPTTQPIDAVLRSAPDGLEVGILVGRGDGPLETTPEFTLIRPEQAGKPGIVGPPREQSAAQIERVESVVEAVA